MADERAVIDPVLAAVIQVDLNIVVLLNIRRMLEDNILQNNILRLRCCTQVNILQGSVLERADQGLVGAHVHFGQARRRDITVDHQ